MRRSRRLDSWTRDVVLSSGKVVRCEWHPDLWAVGMESAGHSEVQCGDAAIWISPGLTDGERWEFMQRLEEIQPCTKARLPAAEDQEPA